MPFIRVGTKVDLSTVSPLVPLTDNSFHSYAIFPGFCDVHVHFREPGFSYKETILTGSLAAAHGGYTAVCTMPNLNPAPDCLPNLKHQTELIQRDAKIHVYPYGCITKNRCGEELSEMEAMAESVVAFSDDGSGVQNDEIMEKAMRKAKLLNKIIAAHCEDTSLLSGGCIHKGSYAEKNGLKGISGESEFKQIERDLELVKKTGCKYHVCHISTKEGVALLRKAKQDGLDVTCETAPHYLVLDDGFLRDSGDFKMNPPLRDKEDREALLAGILDGTIDMIATDHAPHSAEEKSKGLKDSAFGIVGLETAFPILYTKLVLPRIIHLEKLIELMAINPRKRFGIPMGQDFTVWDLNQQATVSAEDWFSKGKSSPFVGETILGQCILTVCGGKAVYIKE